MIEVGDLGIEHPVRAGVGPEGTGRGRHGGHRGVRNEIPTDPVIFWTMAVTVRIPTTLRPLSGGDKLVEVPAGTLSEVIAALEAAHPGLADRLLDEDGALRKFVNIFVDDDDVRYLDGLDTVVADGITVSIIPAVAGG